MKMTLCRIGLKDGKPGWRYFRIPGYDLGNGLTVHRTVYRDQVTGKAAIDPKGPWVVTHARTGRAVNAPGSGSPFDTRKEALRYARHLAEQVDWTLTGLSSKSYRKTITALCKLAVENMRLERKGE
jgi:hypothetical protein